MNPLICSKFSKFPDSFTSPSFIKNFRMKLIIYNWKLLWKLENLICLPFSNCFFAMLQEIFCRGGGKVFLSCVLHVLLKSVFTVYRKWVWFGTNFSFYPRSSIIEYIILRLIVFFKSLSLLTVVIKLFGSGHTEESKKFLAAHPIISKWQNR
jgi:hypothetical protein